MVASNDTPAKLQMPLGKLAVTLLVTAFCSQFSNIALHLLVTNFVNGGIYASASPYSTGIATAVFIVGGPIFLGWYLRPSWRGLASGVLGVITIAGMGYLSALISLELNVNNETLQTLLLGIFEGLGIVVILYVDRRMDLTQERIGTAVGIAIGIAISVLLEIAIVNSGLEVYSLPALSYLPMLWIWLSALFFPELSSHRTSWRGMLIWLAMMLFFTTASLGLLGIGFLRI